MGPAAAGRDAAAAEEELRSLAAELRTAAPGRHLGERDAWPSRPGGYRDSSAAAPTAAPARRRTDNGSYAIVRADRRARVC